MHYTPPIPPHTPHWSQCCEGRGIKHFERESGRKLNLELSPALAPSQLCKLERLTLLSETVFWSEKYLDMIDAL